MPCPQCRCPVSVKNGTRQGKQRYRCRQCGCTYTPSWSGKVHPRIKQMAILLHLNGLGFRRIGQGLGVSHVSVQRWGRQHATAFQPSRPVAGALCETVELDELWHWHGKKTQTLALACCGSNQRTPPRLAVGFSWEKDLETAVGSTGPMAHWALCHRLVEGVPDYCPPATDRKQTRNLYRRRSQ